MTPRESELLAKVGRELWRATLIGDAPPAIAELRDRMRHPQPGDLVLEITRFGAFDPDGIGWLVSMAGDPAAPARVVVEPLHRPGEEQGWQNAQFVALPVTRDRVSVPGQSDIGQQAED